MSKRTHAQVEVDLEEAKPHIPPPLLDLTDDLLVEVLRHVITSKEGAGKHLAAVSQKVYKDGFTATVTDEFERRWARARTKVEEWGARTGSDGMMPFISELVDLCQKASVSPQWAITNAMKVKTYGAVVSQEVLHEMFAVDASVVPPSEGFFQHYELSVLFRQIKKKSPVLTSCWASLTLDTPPPYQISFRDFWRVLIGYLGSAPDLGLVLIGWVLTGLQMKPQRVDLAFNNGMLVTRFFNAWASQPSKEDRMDALVAAFVYLRVFRDWESDRTTWSRTSLDRRVNWRIELIGRAFGLPWLPELSLPVKVEISAYLFGSSKHTMKQWPTLQAWAEGLLLSNAYPPKERE